MKVLFVMNGLAGGGAERVFVDLVRNFNQKKHDVTVLAIDDYGVYKHEVRNMVKYKYVMRHEEKHGFKRKWYGALSVIGKHLIKNLSPSLLYKFIIKEKYDVEIAYIEGGATKIISGSSNPNSVKYAWLHTDMIKNPWSLSVYKNESMEKNAYEKFDRVMAVSESVKEAFEKKYNIPAKVIYNALDENSIVEKSKEKIEPIKKTADLCLVTIGGLREVKGYLRLLKVINRLVKEGISVQLIVVGEGDERTKLEAYIEENNLKENVLLYGFSKNPYNILNQGDLYICSSYAEGFSTTVTESLILGIPVLTTECAGMRELLGDSEYGLIVENSEDGLYEGIKRLANNKVELDKLRAKAGERGKEFTIARRIHEIENLLENDYWNKVNQEVKNEDKDEK